MQDRFSLLFESGDREGERVSIPESGGLVVGRSPGSGLQIIEGSVSGRHASLEVAGGRVELKDLGSTNGTRVGPARVLETPLTHGDLVYFGNVCLRFVDAELEQGAELELEGHDAPVRQQEPAGSRASAEEQNSGLAQGPAAPAAGSSPADALDRIDDDKLRRSKKSGSKLLPALLILVLAGGAYAIYHLKAKGGGAAAIRAVAVITGNQLAGDCAFEEDGDGFDPLGDAPVEFGVDDSANHTGQSGLGVFLEAGEWAMTLSQPVKLSPGRQLTLSAAFEVPPGGRGYLGVEFLCSEDASAPRVTRALMVVEEQGFERVEWTVPVPAGYSRARLFVAARGEGDFAVDDVALVQEPGGAKAERFEETEIWQLGREFCVVEVGQAQLSGLRFGSGDLFLDALPTNVKARPDGFTLAAGAGAAEAGLRFFVEPELMQSGLATLGAAGYTPRALEFDEAGVTSLLAGSGGDLVCLHFPTARRVKGRPEGEGFMIEVDWSAGGELVLQLGFREERATALALAEKARQAERAGEFGDCLTRWLELLDEHPYKRDLVDEAETARGKLIQRGLEELGGVRQEVERARFFRLVDIFRECAAGARAVAERYAPSAVEQQARALLAEIDAELVVLEADLDQVERGRLQGILDILRAQEADDLADEVATYLNGKFEGGR